jgi:hypothetical protein
MAHWNTLTDEINAREVDRCLRRLAVEREERMKRKAEETTDAGVDRVRELPGPRDDPD